MSIDVDRGLSLAASRTAPSGPSRGIVVFAHGSGSSRHSPRNRQVAATLHASGLGTLLLDLLTTSEEAVDMRTGEHRFDVHMLGDRVVAAIDWLRQVDDSPIGLFGASTGAAAALIAAAGRDPSMCLLSSPEVAAQIWPATICRRSAPRLFSSWAVVTRRCWR